MCDDIVSDGDDCSTLTYWISGEPSSASQRCAQAGWIANAVDNLLDDDTCTNTKNVVCDPGMLTCDCS